MPDVFTVFLNKDDDDDDGPTPYPLKYHFSMNKVPLSYTFY